jgi:hypothetical protein
VDWGKATGIESLQTSFSHFPQLSINLNIYDLASLHTTRKVPRMIDIDIQGHMSPLIYVYQILDIEPHHPPPLHIYIFIG